LDLSELTSRIAEIICGFGATVRQCFSIIMANVNQYFMNKMPRMLIGIIQLK
jgi:hypothetical protein